MSITVVQNYCSKRLHMQEFSGKIYFDKEVEVFNSILLKLFFFSKCALFIHLSS